MLLIILLSLYFFVLPSSTRAAEPYDVFLIQDFSAASREKCCNLPLDITEPRISFVDLPNQAQIKDRAKLEIKVQVRDESPVELRLEILKLTDSNNPVLSTSFQSVTLDKEFLVETWNLSAVKPGKYQFEILARDKYGYTSSLTRQIELIWPTQANLLVQRENDFFPVREHLNNSSFEDGLSDWQASDLVSVQTSFLRKTPKEGERLVVLKSKPNSETQLSQTINLTPAAKHLTFWYLLDFKQPIPTNLNFMPIFMVLVNGQVKYLHQPISVNSETSARWQMATVSLDQDTNINHPVEIKFATNPNFSEPYSVAIDLISTQGLIVNSQDQLRLESNLAQNTEEIFYNYQVWGRTLGASLQPGDTFAVHQAPTNGTLSYWSVNKQGLQEEVQKVPLIVDSIAPEAVSDLKVYQKSRKTYALTFTAPGDNLFQSAQAYEIRYSWEPSQFYTNWQQLPKPSILDNDNLPGNSRPPARIGLEEEYLIEIDFIDQAQPIYFAIKVIDQAGNESIINFTTILYKQDKYQYYATSPIVINEVMFNPLGFNSDLAPNGEWIELYNRSDYPVKLSGYYLQDGSGRRILLDQVRTVQSLVELDSPPKKTNLIIPAQGFVIVYKNGFEWLNNDGDSISLHNDRNQMVSSYYYQGQAPEGNTEARVIDGQANWSFNSIPTPGRPNAITVEDLRPQARLNWNQAYSLKIHLFDGQKYQEGQYLLEYSHLQGSHLVSEALKGSFKIKSNHVIIDDLFLGTCSDRVCLTHNQIDPNSFKLTIELESDLQSQKIITGLLQFSQ